MKTTALVAELLVVGVGAAGWCVLLLLLFVPQLEPALARIDALAILPLAAVVYLLGVLTDRAADAVLKRPLGQTATGAWKDKRNRVLDASPTAREWAEYARSRMRILRGWVLNSAVLTVSAPLYLATRDCAVCSRRSAAAALIGFAGLGAACFLACRVMEREGTAAINRMADALGVVSAPNDKASAS